MPQKEPAKTFKIVATGTKADKDMAQELKDALGLKSESELVKQLLRKRFEQYLKRKAAADARKRAKTAATKKTAVAAKKKSRRSPATKAPTPSKAAPIPRKKPSASRARKAKR